ncbi:hypothetical protein LR48_Vigan09g108900 [Vigna angularis]|uniref:Uncharacterized protein n=1 Tax=Phaseolus angularis TaxID=3914 RepID=A0A0L9VBJ1_PHAAN|nr:hypothetical protein LR48_Vigan09g108900 [Vigna angularis]
MGQMVMTESELGPSPSEVATAIARKPVIDEGEHERAGGWSLDRIVEGLQSKLERWRSDLPPVIDQICSVECYVGSDSKGKKGRCRSASMDDNTSSLL